MKLNRSMKRGLIIIYILPGELRSYGWASENAGIASEHRENGIPRANIVSVPWLISVYKV